MVADHVSKCAHLRAKSRTIEEKLEKLKVAGDTKRPVKVKADMSFGDWLDFWCQTHSKPGLRPATCQSYENWLYDHLIPSVGHIPLCKLAQSAPQQFFTDMKRNGRRTQVESKGAGMSDRSVRSCYVVCHIVPGHDQTEAEGAIVSHREERST